MGIGNGEPPAGAGQPEAVRPVTHQPSTEQPQQKFNQYGEIVPVMQPPEPDQGAQRAAEAPKRMTKADAEAKVAEAKQVYVDLMQAMLKSREVQGPYCAQFSVSGKDMVVALMSPVESVPGRADTRAYVLVTEGGVQLVDQNSNEAYGRFLDGLKNRLVTIKDSQYTVVREDVSNKLEITYDHSGLGEYGKKIVLPLYPPGQNGENIFNQAVDQSIKEAEAPHKALFEKAQKSVDIGKSLAAKISSLPPRE